MKYLKIGIWIFIMLIILILVVPKYKTIGEEIRIATGQPKTADVVKQSCDYEGYVTGLCLGEVTLKKTTYNVANDIGLTLILLILFIGTLLPCLYYTYTNRKLN